MIHSDTRVLYVMQSRILKTIGCSNNLDLLGQYIIRMGNFQNWRVQCELHSNIWCVSIWHADEWFICLVYLPYCLAVVFCIIEYPFSFPGKELAHWKMKIQIKIVPFMWEVKHLFLIPLSGYLKSYSMMRKKMPRLWKVYKVNPTIELILYQRILTLRLPIRL